MILAFAVLDEGRERLSGVGISILTGSWRCSMWRVSYKTMSLQAVLIMSYMNVLEAKSRTRPAGDGDVRPEIGNAIDCESRHHKTI
jgi:hypothetical protein